MMAGNAVVPYEAGQVALIGSNLPHNWVSDIAPGERLRQRDVVCHVRPETIRLLMSGFPETSGFAMVLRRAGQALVLSGESARQAGSILESMEEHSLACRVSDLIRVLDVFAHAPADESYTVVASGYDPAVCSGAESVVNDAIEYISSHLSGEISLDLAARQAGMSVSAFSRLFKRAAGIRFSDFVRRLRIGHACRLLTTTNQSVASIRRACGYGNINGRTLEEYFPSKLQQREVNSPIVLLKLEGKFDVVVLVDGGGTTGQAGAIRLGVARALNAIDRDANRAALKKAGFLTRDARVVERKKAGLHKARRAPQFSKR